MKKLTCSNIYTDFPPILTENDTVAIDLEIAELKEGQLHRPYGRLLSIAASFDGDTAYIMFDKDDVPEFLRRIEKATWVFHNATFDLGHLRRWADVPERKNMRDTLLLDRILWSNYYEKNAFSLKDLVRRYLGCFMEKDIRDEFSNHSGIMTKEQIEYAALDVVATWLVEKEQRKYLSKVDDAVWTNLYNPHVWTTLELGGFTMDVEKWKEIAHRNQLIVDRIETDLGRKYGATVKKMVGRGKARAEQEVFVPFNPSSTQQVQKILKENYGIESDSSDEDSISPYAEENEFVRDILEYRKAKKQTSTYGLDFLQYVEDDGKIYTSLNIGLAETGRDSSSSPNLQNIPTEKERRACFKAALGKKLGLYDYSGQEASIWAFITKDEKFKDIINNGKKLYIEVARIAFHEDVKKGTPRYNAIKSLVLGLMYGLSPYGYAKQEGIEMEEAQAMFDAFFAGFPASAQFVREQQSVNKGYTQTILGRRAHLHPYDRQWKNNALNSPMQGSGGDMIKLAMKNLRNTEFYKKHHPTGELNLVLQVHDEIITEVDEKLAEEWSAIMKATMISSAEMLHPGIKASVSGGIIDNWSEKE